MRVPLLNASLTDAVFELEQTVSAEEVNAAFETAAGGDLRGSSATKPGRWCRWIM